MSGYEGDLSEVQAAALAEMKTKLGGLLELPACKTMAEKFISLDSCCLRFLRFCSFNADQAKEKFQATLQWRIENKVDGILAGDDIIEKIRPYWPGAYHGFSKENHPVQFFNVGYANPGLIMSSFNEEELRHFYIYWMERSLELQREATAKVRKEKPDAPPIRGTIEIFDLSGLYWGQLHMQGLALLAKVLGIGSTHYPSNLCKGFIINSGYIFSGAWKVISPVLHAQTRERITVDGGPCKEALEAMIEVSLIPEIFKSVKAPPTVPPSELPAAEKKEGEASDNAEEKEGEKKDEAKKE